MAIRASAQVTPSFLSDAEPDPVPSDKLEAVLRVADELVEAEERADALERELKSVVERRNTLRHKTLPDAMDAAGTDHVGLPERGVDVVLKPWFDGSLPSAEKPVERQIAIDWLVDSGHSDLIKTTVAVLFSRTEHNLAVSTFEAIKQYLAEQGLPNIVAMKEDIHFMTYRAFLREQTEQGVVLPLDKLNATVGRVAKIQKRDK